MTRWLAAILLVAACGSKKPARDCTAYANKVADLSDPAPGKRDYLVTTSERFCEDGTVKDRELTCVMGAKTRAELIECTTGRPAVSSIDADPPPPPPPASNKVTLLAAQNVGNFKPIDVDRYEDQAQWFEKLKQEIAACATDEVFDPPREYVVLVTFSPQTPAVSPGGMPEPPSHCVKAVLSQRPPASVGNGAAEFYINVGR